MWKCRSTKDRFLTEWIRINPSCFLLLPSGSLKKKKSSSEDDLSSGLATPRSSLEIFPFSNAGQKCAWHVNQVLSPFETDLEHIKPYELFDGRFFLDSFPRTYLPESCSNTFCRFFLFFSSFVPHSFVSSDLEENVWGDEKLCRDAT